jgi:hypothetical protein
LLILRRVSKSSGSKKHKQNCRTDGSSAFHWHSLNSNLNVARRINCILLTDQRNARLVGSHFGIYTDLPLNVWDHDMLPSGLRDRTTTKLTPRDN